MYTVVRKTKVTKTIELVSPLNDCYDGKDQRRSHFQEFQHYHSGLSNTKGAGVSGSTCSSATECNNDQFNNGLKTIVSSSRVHRSNSSPTKPIGRKATFCGGGRSGISSSSFSNGASAEGGGARRSYQQNFFDDDYIVTYTSSSSSSTTSRTSASAGRHQTVTKRNGDNGSNDDEFKNR